MTDKDFKDKISDFDKSNPLSIFYEFGFLPPDIKEAIVDCFSTFFENPSLLKKYAISHLSSTWIAYLMIDRDKPSAIPEIEKILAVFNDAKQIEEKETLSSYLFWFSDISQSISRYWSIYNNQRDLEKLCLEDFVEEAFRVIGQTIEGLSKPFLQLLLSLNRIGRKKPRDNKEINSRDLGIVIDELINTSELKDLLTIGPLKIRLNQWRNIAYHHNYKVVNDEIICSYKNSGQFVEFKITRQDLLRCLKDALLTFKLIRISETIFAIDNIETIHSLGRKANVNDINFREESKLLDFQTPITSQGFKVIELKYDSDQAVLGLQEMQDYPHFSERAIHTSQFLYNLWLFSGSRKVRITYHLPNGERFLTSEFGCQNFDKVDTTKTSLAEILKDVQFTFLTVKFAQNVNPFKTLRLPKSIKSHPHKFYSQLSERITVKEFIRQFTMSVLCNYLVLKSEKLTNIVINVGSDGSMQRTEGLAKNFLFTVPAPIQSKELQLKIIDMLNKVSELYELYQLEKEFVDETKNRNNFVFKKAMVREQLNERNSNQ